MRHLLSGSTTRTAALASAALALTLIMSACSGRATDDNNPPPGDDNSCSEPATCTDALPESVCNGRVAISFTRDPLGCSCEPFKQYSDCAARGKRCVDGRCVEPSASCLNKTCPPPENRCEGSVAINYLGAGVCEDASGECDYSGSSTELDCASLGEGFTCESGRCLPPEDPCAGDACRRPRPECEGDTAITYTGPGTCTPDGAQAQCDYSRVTERTDCTDRGFVCRDGACVDPNDPCLDVTCDMPPADACDGDTAVTYPMDATGTCDAMSGACDYSAAEERTDCAMSGQVCLNGACVDPGDPCDGVMCLPPAPSCDGDTAVSYMDMGTCDMMTGMCDYSAVEVRTDCTADNKICRNGMCQDPMADPCMNVTCDMPPADSCDGDTAVTHSGDGTCDMMTGTCDYSAVEVRTDCTMTGEVCQGGACVDLCMGVTCAQPADACDMDVAVTYSGDGTCDPMTGMCDYSAVETRTDCTMTGEVCQSGACMMPADPCMNVTCDMPPADSCDGDTAVTYPMGSMGTCDMMTGTCDYSAVEVRTDCTMTGEVCQGGACVDLCMGVTCAQPADACDMDVAVTYSGDGTCDPMTGMCDYSAVETRTDCAAMMMTCMMGACQ